MSVIAEQTTIERAAQALIEASPAPAKVLLFGSRARGDADERSDFDFLVIEHEVDDRFEEMARLSWILGRLLIPADVVVVSEQYAQRWGGSRGRWSTRRCARVASLPNPDARELALLLQRKALSDEAILAKLLDDPDIPDDALGFHVQQAVEKRLKAVLAINDVEFEHTHSIGYLTALLERHGIESPEHHEQLKDLTPWAVDARYSDQLVHTLDRAAVRDLVTSVREWSQRLLGSDQQEPEDSSRDSDAG